MFCISGQPYAFWPLCSGGFQKLRSSDLWKAWVRNTSFELNSVFQFDIGVFIFSKRNEVKIEMLGQLELSKMRCLICILLNFKYFVSCVLFQIKHICTVLLLITLFFFLLLPNICWIMFLGSDRKNCWDSSFLMLFVKKILYWKLCWVLSKSSHTDKVVTKIIFWMKSTIILKSEIWFKISSGYFCV